MTATRLLPLLPALGLLAAAHGAAATTLTTSFGAWKAGVAGKPYATTGSTGLADPFALYLPTTTSVTLSDGNVLFFSNAAQVTQPQDGFPYLLSDGSSPDLLIPVDGNGNQLQTETVNFAGSVSALGFSVAPFSSSQSGSYTISVKLSDGEMASVSLPGGSFNTGITVPGFIGYYGGGITSLTLTTSDPNGFAFGNFVDVPEPASAVLLAGSTLVLALNRRRKRTPAQD